MDYVIESIYCKIWEINCRLDELHVPASNIISICPYDGQPSSVMIWFVVNIIPAVTTTNQQPNNNVVPQDINVLAANWILQHGTAPAFRQELRNCVRWIQKQLQMGNK